ncbi:MAG: magnetochrome domain-containing protein [Magnetococcales bacterium]|nr:magnetochrome domain-containing protein [Magnetococcales bacterium]
MNNIAAWIMASAIVLGAGLFLIAVFEENPWDDHSYDEAPAIVAGAPSPHPDDRGHMVCSSCHEILVDNISNQKTVPPITSGATAPHLDARRRQVCSNCHRIMTQAEAAARQAQREKQIARQSASPGVQMMTVAMTPSTNRSVATPPPAARTVDPEWHERFTTVRFQGKVIRVVNQSQRSSGRKNVTIQVSNEITSPAWYNLAPAGYLKENGCGIRNGMYIKGTAFKEMGAGKGALLYAASISVNGEVCPLRDSHMLGMWEGGRIGHHGMGGGDEE